MLSTQVHRHKQALHPPICSPRFEVQPPIQQIGHILDVLSLPLCSCCIAEIYAKRTTNVFPTFIDWTMSNGHLDMCQCISLRKSSHNGEAPTGYQDQRFVMLCIELYSFAMCLYPIVSTFQVFKMYCVLYCTIVQCVFIQLYPYAMLSKCIVYCIVHVRKG